MRLQLPNIKLVGYSCREFNKKNNNIQQVKANTIIKLFVKVCNKLEHLDDRLIKLETRN